VIWASPDCSTFSVAAISHHRRKNPETGSLDPISDYAKFCDEVDQHVLALIRELKPKYWFIENPRGGMRKMSWMQGLPRYTVTYCKYELDKPVEQRRMKPTDIWTNHPNPNFIPACKNGEPCHAKAPRGSSTGTQGMKNAREKGVIPDALCDHIVLICSN
jgi:site-specific DNA-cytosine methylase